MGKRGFGGKRRTVLQLDDGSRKQPTYGLGYRASSEEPAKPDGNAKGLSGLMSQYAQDSETEDSDEDVDTSVYDLEAVANTKPSTQQWQKFVAATDTAPPPPPAPADDDDHVTTKSSPVTSKSVSSVGAEQKDEIDLKLQDFLAEIDSIEMSKDDDDIVTKDAVAAADDGIDGIPIPADSGAAAAVTPVENGKKVLEKVSAKVSAKTSSQPINDVDSEEDDEFKAVAPQEPKTVWQQCLDDDTQCYYYWNYETNEVTWEIPAEFSQYLLLYQEYEQALPRYEREYAEWRKARRRHRASKKKHRKHSRKPESDVVPLVSYQSAEDDDDARTPAPVYGPFLPSQDSATKQPDPPAAEATTSSSSQKPEQIRTERSSASTKTETTERPVKKDERFDDEIQKLKALHEKFQKRAQQLKQFTSKDSDAKETASVGESPDLQPVSDVPSRPTTMVESVPEVPCSASEVEVATEETLQAADDQTFVRFEYTNRRYESDEAAGPAEEMELDVEDIDKQLEMALAQHKGRAESKCDRNLVTSNSDIISVEAPAKRKADAEFADDQLPVKKMKSEDDEVMDLLPKRILSSDIKAKISELSEISELSSVIAEKLDFLEVTRAGLSKLQLLLVQLETRVEDWRAGALSSERFVDKLRESCATLRQYEANATPPGWSCHWHSQYKRYFYCHDVAGITRWDYPEGPEPDDQTDEQQHRDVLDEAELDTVEYQTVVPSSTNPPPAAEIVCPELQAEVFPGEPLPPGVDPPLPGALSANILALAGCPPPPPPMTPPDVTASDELRADEEGQTEENDSHRPSDHPVRSPVSDEEQMPDSAIPDSDPEAWQNMVEISAPPVLNRPSSPHTTNAPGIVETECTEVNSPTADVTVTLSPSHVSSPSTSTTVADDVTTHPHRERRKKKDKALVAAGLSLKKKNVSSLVEKWQRVQKDVTDEMSKEHSKKIKKTSHE